MDCFGVVVLTMVLVAVVVVAGVEFVFKKLDDML